MSELGHSRRMQSARLVMVCRLFLQSGNEINGLRNGERMLVIHSN
jgi:hypothetical protein